MGGATTGRTKITRTDIHKAESLPTLVAELVRRCAEGTAEVKEYSCTALQEVAKKWGDELKIEWTTE